MPSSPPRMDAETRARYGAARVRVLADHPQADAVLRAQTAFASLWDLLRRTGANGFTPSCRLDLHPDQAIVGDIFDAAMRALDDPRRAIRWGAPTGRRAA